MRATLTSFSRRLVCYLLRLQNPAPEAVDRYRSITSAYETLSDAETRSGYDDFLAHPERVFANRMRYYQHQYRHAKQVDARLILLVMLTLATIAHFQYWNHRYTKLRTMLATSPGVVTRMRNKCKADLVEERIRAGEKKVRQLDASLARSHWK